jgi:hypothetical protein
LVTAAGETAGSGFTAAELVGGESDVQPIEPLASYGNQLYGHVFGMTPTVGQTGTAGYAVEVETIGTVGLSWLYGLRSPDGDTNTLVYLEAICNASGSPTCGSQLIGGHGMTAGVDGPEATQSVSNLGDWLLNPATNRFVYLTNPSITAFCSSGTCDSNFLSGIALNAGSAVFGSQGFSSGGIWRFNSEVGSTSSGSIQVFNGGASPVLNSTTVEVAYCGLTSGGSQPCAKTIQANPIVVYGEVALNTATSQSITTLPFTAGADYSCTGSDLTTVTGIVSFNTYAAASVTIQESGGVNTDHLRYICVGF